MLASLLISIILSIQVVNLSSACNLVSSSTSNRGIQFSTTTTSSITLGNLWATMPHPVQGDSSTKQAEELLARTRDSQAKRKRKENAESRKKRDRKYYTSQKKQSAAAAKKKTAKKQASKKEKSSKKQPGKKAAKRMKSDSNGNAENNVAEILCEDIKVGAEDITDENFDELWEQAMDFAKSTTQWLSPTPGMMCANCCRSPIVFEPDSPYFFKCCRIHSHKIKTLHTPLRRIQSHKKKENAVGYVLCEECYAFLGVEESMSEKELSLANKSRYEWRNVWPSFFLDLIIGRDQASLIPFRETYPTEYLWRFVPSSVRRYWLSYLVEGGYVGDCSLSHPPSFFQDRTEDIEHFQSNIELYTYAGFLRALDPSRLPGIDDHSCRKPIMLPDVLCPVSVDLLCLFVFFDDDVYDVQGLTDFFYLLCILHQVGLLRIFLFELYV